MEYIKRKIKIEELSKIEKKTMRIDIIDGMRMSLRFVDEDKTKDIVLNFTKEETEKISKILKESK